MSIFNKVSCQVMQKLLEILHNGLLVSHKNIDNGAHQYGQDMQDWKQTVDNVSLP